MFDVDQRRRISIEELRDHLVGGGNFEAETEETGRDCTMEVLRRVMGGDSMDPLSGQGVPVPGLSPLGGLGGLGSLLGLAGVIGDRVDTLRRDNDNPPPRPQRPRARSTDWADPAPDGGSV